MKMKTPEQLIQQALEALIEIKRSHPEYWQAVNVHLRESEGKSLVAAAKLLAAALALRLELKED
jgi:hypothetical protein